MTNIIKWQDVLEIKNGRDYKKVKDENGEYPVYGSGGIMGYANDYICPPKTVIIGRKGNINNPIFVDSNFWNVDTAFGLVVDEKYLNPKYLYYFCVKFNFDKLNTTVTIPSLTKSNLLKIEMELPSLDVQKHIVNTLDKIQEIIEIKKIQLEELDNLIKATFYGLFGDLILNDRNWEEFTVEKVCKNIIGGGTPSKRKPEYYIGNIPWVTPKDMKATLITDSIDHINDEAIKNSSAKLIPANSLLMVIRSGILKRKLPVAINKVPVTVNQDMKAFILNDAIKPEYLLFYFISSQNYFLKNVRSVTADNIEFKLIKEAKIPLPPIELQNDFSKIVSNIEKQKSIVNQSLKESQTLFNSLMSKYFD